ncbi:MAG: translation initiation factor IF-2 [Patescibacteria group bacterium]
MNGHIAQSHIPRPPIVVVMGHIDHGKSTLLDYIRKTNVVAGESGGITQHISAYEASHKTKEGKEMRITFLDTPGHAAFSAMRAHGATAADVAVLVVSAEDGVKAQTIEAVKAITSAQIPYVVAINKIDKPNADSEKIKRELSEHEIYLEGYGGDVPVTAISAKTGEGIPDLLDLIVLISELANLTGNLSLPAEGFVIESHRDPKRGVSASIVITNGTLTKGSFVCAGDAIAPVRAIQDSLGKIVASATFSSPVLIAGFDAIPPSGALFKSFKEKCGAEDAAAREKERAQKERARIIGNPNAKVSLPLVLKTDAQGTREAVIQELSKIEHPKVNIRIVHSGVGDISENDVKIAAGSEHARIVGFRVSVDKRARETAERSGVSLETFAIIYNITDYIESEVAKRAPKEEMEETRGEARILRTFSASRDKQVVGGTMLSGALAVRNKIKILRRGVEIGQGEILELQQQKVKTSEVRDGEFGIMIESRMEIASGDTIAAFMIVTK